MIIQKLGNAKREKPRKIKQHRDLDNINDLHKFYLGENVDLIKQLKKDKVTYRHYRVLAYKRLFELRKWINRNTNTNIDEIRKFKISREEIKWKHGEFGTSSPKKQAEVAEHLDFYYEAERIVKNTDGLLDEIANRCVLDVNLFNYINIRFGDLIYDALIEGYVFEMIDGVGDLAFVLKEKKPKTTYKGNAQYPVNWGESNKLKQEIIARGGTPYNELDAPHGEKWMIFHTEAYPYLNWIKGQGALQNSSSRFYSFKATRTSLDKMYTKLREDEFATINLRKG